MLMSFGVVPGCGEEVYGAARLPPEVTLSVLAASDT